MNPSLILVALAVIGVPTLARPQQGNATPQQYSQANAQAHSDSAVTPIPIVSQTEVVGVDGSFNYSYETGNGIHVEQGGYVKKAAESRIYNASNPDENNDVQVIQGSFSFTAPDGQVYNLRYIADENGFQPEGDHLPTPPAPLGAAPVPAVIQQQQQQQNQQFQQQQGQQLQQQQQFQTQPQQQAQG